jgi:hypothetical protein
MRVRRLNFEEEDSPSSGWMFLEERELGLKTHAMKRMMRIILFSVVTRVLAKSGVQQQQQQQQQTH